MSLRRRRWAAAAWALALAAGLRVECTAAEQPNGIVFLPVALKAPFPEAVAPDALRYACSKSEAELRSFFAARGVLLSEALLHRRGAYPSCHLFYEPSVKGFRALTEDRPVTGLYVAVAPEGFLVGRDPIGDSLDVAKAVLSRIARPLDVMVSIAGDYDASHWPAAAERHFGGLPHRFRYRKSGAKTPHPWAQDHQKAGSVGGELRVLVPRRLYEGRREDGEAFAPLLDQLAGEMFVRSKLAWEGGDLQFVRHPRSPERTILVHGGTVYHYWGNALPPLEVSYVLLAEFGADLAVDVSGTQSHADYVAAFLPDAPVALVASPVVGDAVLLRAAAEALVAESRPFAPAAADLERFLAGWDGVIETSATALRNLVDTIWVQLDGAQVEPSPGLEEDLAHWTRTHCGGRVAGCFDGAGRDKMLRLALDLVRRADNESASLRMTNEMTDRLIGTILAQLPRPLEFREKAMAGVRASLQTLGFDTVDVPFVYAPELETRWAGVSYVNVLIVDKTIFVPSLGLGAAERRYFDQMRRKIGRGYQVVPVDARFGVLNNGGIHCVFAVHREPLRTASPADRVSSASQ